MRVVSFVDKSDQSRVLRELDRRIFLGAFCLALISSNSAFASAIYTVEAQTGVAVGPVSSNAGTAGTIGQSGTSTQQLSVGAPADPGVYPDGYTADAGSIAGPNLLGVEADVSAQAAGNVYLTGQYAGYVIPSIASSAAASAELQDTLQLSANAPTNGMLTIYVKIDGSGYTYAGLDGSPNLSTGVYGISDTPRPNSGTCAVLDAGGTPPPDCGSLSDGVNTLEIPYTLGANNTVPFELDLDTSVICSAQYPGLDLIGSCISNSTFLHTVQVASIVVSDSNGNPVPGAYATSLSGVSYTLPLNAAPEPSTFAMLSAGGLGAFLFVFRRGARILRG